MGEEVSQVSPESTVYKGKTGQWAFVLHRITGFLVLMFILLHIVDVSMLNFPRIYNEIHALYGNVLMRLFEVGLLFGLVYHALNGLRVIMIDFFPGSIKNEKSVFYGIFSLTILLTIIGGVIILRPFFTGSVH
ncbi:MAG: succinate dehydrogenase, cytochrome b556 subunit [Actinomycetota bacterium]|nr:succinate dehydrogenase, cytochrome b556 subunit [Actinomycetota bacterium]